MRHKTGWALAILALALPLCAGAAGGGAVKGKVNAQGKALAGAVVSFYSGYEGGFHGKPAFESKPTGDDGLFEVNLPKGRYYVLARKLVNGTSAAVKPGDHFAYYGGNPVVVGEGESIAIGINCSEVIDVGARKQAGGTGIRGKVLADGKPLDRARVTLYQDGETIFRGIGYASGLTNAKGEFSFNLEPGSYYVVARKRAGDDKMGPLGGGDYFGYAHDNPVGVDKDGYTVISISAVNKLVKVKEGGEGVTLGGTVKAGETMISGVVRDKGGKPVKGVYAAAYRDAMMTQKPDFISLRTGADGAYAIQLSGGGEYFVGARNTIGGPAEKGDLLGKYDGNEDHAVRLKDGDKVKSIDIVVEVVE
jgi:hypothetical protein